MTDERKYDDPDIQKFAEENREMIGGFYETKEDGKGWYKISVDDFISGKKNYELMLNYFF